MGLEMNIPVKPSPQSIAINISIKSKFPPFVFIIITLWGGEVIQIPNIKFTLLKIVQVQCCLLLVPMLYNGAHLFILIGV